MPARHHFVNWASMLKHHLLKKFNQPLRYCFGIATSAALVLVAYFLALSLQLNFSVSDQTFSSGIVTPLGLVVIAIALDLMFRYYGPDPDLADARSTLTAGIGTILAAFLGYVLNVLVGGGQPATLYMVFALALFAAKLFVHLILTRLFESSRKVFATGVPVAVYGAGAGGVQLVAALKNTEDYNPVLLVDDSKHLQGQNISGLRVTRPSTIREFVKAGKVDKIFLAIPTISAAKKEQIIRSLSDLECEVQAVPSYVEIIQSGGVFPSLRPVTPEDLLGRDGIEVDVPETRSVYQQANILVSGGGGSIGSELCRRLLEFRPNKLVLLETSEFALYAVEQELKSIAEHQNTELVTILGSVLDRPLLDRLLVDHSISVILHAAAYKHVPLLEDNSLAAIRNNIFGTRTIAEAAIENKVERFTFVSTDKAVRPTNIMGASKRFAELVIQDLQSRHNTTFF